MSEAIAIANSASPATVDSLVKELRHLGVSPGSALLVHSSLSALSWVNGGPVAVIDALLQAASPRGTLVMPTHSADYSDPANWRNPSVPSAWFHTIRDTMPAFDPQRTPTHGMGIIPETFRTLPGVLRSHHPTSSFAALGPLASSIVAEHPLTDPLGETSPLGKLYELNAHVLLLGVGHDCNTSLHLAERKAFGESNRRVATGSPILAAGRREWVSYEEPALCSDDFADLARDFEASRGPASIGTVAAATARLMPLRAIVDFGTHWLRQHRHPDGTLRS